NATLYLNIISSTKNCTASFIAEKIGISKAAVTMRINELIEKGLVVKKQSDNDKRINYLFLSKEIEKETNEYNSFFELMTKEIENNYSKDEIDIFCNVLNSFCEID
ncbi:MAG: MarR family winged helix-turn-helix transcriptional regulator, partial [Clostridia bacterium]